MLKCDENASQIQRRVVVYGEEEGGRRKKEEEEAVSIISSDWIAARSHQSE
jgi:hypothetical protein